MKAKKLLLAGGVVALLSPAIAASAMKASGSSFDGAGWAARINGALAMMGLAPELPAKAAPAAEPGQTRLPFTRQPHHRGFAYGPLIWPQMADVPALMEALGLAGGPVGGGIGGSQLAAAAGDRAGTGGERQSGAANGVGGGFGGGGAGGGAGFGGAGGTGGGALDLAELIGEEQTPPELGSDTTGTPETPIAVAPVPASVWMMLAGVAGFVSLGILRRRHSG